MAVPGSPLDPRAQGCNQLIRDGATLVQSADDVMEAISPMRIRPFRQKDFDYVAPEPGGDVDDGLRGRVAGLLNGTPVPVDEIVRQAGAPPALVQTALLELELAGTAGAPCRRQGEPRRLTGGFVLDSAGVHGM
jgi:DNA processing protein